MDRKSQDWDLTTSALPEVIEQLIAGWADAVWDVGREFGTIALRKGSAHIEITTYRSDEYDPTSRKPQVRFGDSLDGDLSRRDFAVNSMAVRISAGPDTAPDDGAIDWTFVDPHGGLADLTARMLRTPVAAGISFGDDPLRMDNSLDRSSCGKFVPPGKIVSTKGKDQKDNSCKSKKKKKKKKCENGDDED